MQAQDAPQSAQKLFDQVSAICEGLFGKKPLYGKSKWYEIDITPKFWFMVKGERAKKPGIQFIVCHYKGDERLFSFGAVPGNNCYGNPSVDLHVVSGNSDDFAKMLQYLVELHRRIH